MDGYQRRTEFKKEQIKRAALELFTAYGIDKVSLAEIAQKAGVSPVTIYNYFGTKDKLVHKVMTDLMEELWQERLALLRSDLPYRDKIERMIFDTSGYARTLDPDMLKLLMSSDPDIKSLVEEMAQRQIPVLIDFIDEGRKKGYINADISNEAILMYINILKEASGRIEVFKDREKNVRLMKELAWLFFYGLLNAPQPSGDTGERPGS